MGRPRIGINCRLLREGRAVVYKLDRRYVASVERAGGMPVLMPCFRSAGGARAFLAELDGIVMTGGSDPHARRWKERLHPKADLLLPEKEEGDFLALGAALRRNLPVLAVCAGMQELNIALGGSLHQHIYDLADVRNHSDGARHGLVMTGPSRTREILGAPRGTVPSYHHQACNRVGRGLTVTARSPDGLIEGVESTRHRYVVGVQWHPERMPRDRRQQALFDELVRESRC